MLADKAAFNPEFNLGTILQTSQQNMVDKAVSEFKIMYALSFLDVLLFLETPLNSARNNNGYFLK